MRRIVVIGGGKIGGVIAQMLAECGDYAVTLIDRSPAALQAVVFHPRLSPCVLDVADAGALDAALTGAFAVLSAAPFHLTGLVAEAAARV
ncbi:MAG: saccharopine dehydrogenase, partial [Rhizobiales bacterium 17-65-6]